MCISDWLITILWEGVNFVEGVNYISCGNEQLTCKMQPRDTKIWQRIALKTTARLLGLGMPSLRHGIGIVSCGKEIKM